MAAGQREAFRHVLRAIVDWRGQIVTMNDRAYLTEFIPTLVIWGEDDTVIPVAHAYAAEQTLPHAAVKVFKDAGHFPTRNNLRCLSRRCRNSWQPRSQPGSTRADGIE